MDKKEFLPTVKLEELRPDEPKITKTDVFWKNVPETRDGYVLTSRVTGV